MQNRISSTQRVARTLAAVCVLLAAVQAWPQATPGTQEYKAVYLKHLSSRSDAEDCLNTLRNMALPGLRVYYDPSSNSISLRGTSEEVQQAQQIIAALDVPRASYRLTYTFTQTDNGQRIGVQRDFLVDMPGQESSMKVGSRVPIFESSGTEQTASNANITYLDIGLLIDARLNGSPEGLSLQSRITQSSVADDKQNPSMADPVIRATELNGITTVEIGKPMKLGSLDIPGSTRHLDVEVLVEPIR